MQYLLLDAQGIIVFISDTIGYEQNGHVRVNNDTLLIPATSVSSVAEVSAVPEGVMPVRYRYVDGAFSVNENWVEWKTAADIAVEEMLDFIEGDAPMKEDAG